MKSMGVNAIRTSHNPPAPELLELTDRMGLLVMDEAFDMWEIPKVRNGLSKYWKEWFDADLREFIRRDRNHPSVVLWSIGNEIPEQGRPDGGLLAQKLTNIVHEEDRTRPTTAGFNNDTGAIKNELARAVDIPAFNYKPTKYGQILKDHPNWIIFASETSSGGQFARRIPPADREVPEASLAATHQLRRNRAAVGLHSRCRVRCAGEESQRAGRVRLDRFRLPRRAHALLQWPRHRQ